MKKLLLLGIFWFCSNCVSKAEVKPGVEYEYFTQGETISLQCMSNAKSADWSGPAQDDISNATKVTAVDIYGKAREWKTLLYANGEQINPRLHHKNRLQIAGNKEIGDFNLQIRNVSKEDEGLYICLFTEKNKSLSTKLFVLQKKKYPSKIVFENTTEDDIINGIEFKALTIKCSVEKGKPPETLSLIRQNKTLNMSGNGHIEFSFIPTKLDHNITYTCEAKSPLSNSTLQKNVRINVKYKPMVSTIGSMTVEINEGTKKNLCCNVDSNPPSTLVRWYRGSNTLFAKQNNNNICYLIEEVSRYDHGNYTCIAENEIGSDSASIVLKVEYPPEVHLDYKNFTIHDKLRKIKCKAEGYPTNYKYGVWEHRSEFNEHIRYLNSTDEDTLIIPRNSETYNTYQDSGEYICKATNGVPNEMNFKQGQAYIVSEGPPVFVNQNNAIQYGTLGKTMSIKVNILSYSNITCKTIKALDSFTNVHNVHIKPLQVMDVFYSQNITVNGVQVAFGFNKLEHNNFQVYNITVCNEFGNTSYIVNLVSTDADETDGKIATGRTSITLVSCLIVVAVILLLIAVCIVKIRKKTNNGNRDEDEETVEGLAEPVENVMYQSAQGQNNVQSSPASTLLPGDDTISDIGSSFQGTMRQSMESRLNYADVVFEPSSSQGEVRIIGLEDRIEYADVDIALVAPSFPETQSDTSSSEDDFVYVDGIENFIEKRETND